MAIVNRTPDSFYDQGATYADAAALDRVAQVVAEGADIVDIGGVKAGYGDEVDAAEELRRTAAFVEQVRSALPRPGDQRRHLARRGRRASCASAAPTCSTTPGPAPTRRSPRWPPSSASGWSAATPAACGRVPTRTGPRTTTSCADVIAAVTALAERAVAIGVRARRDPDRPDPRLRQEHLPLARAHPAARRARRDRLAGARRAVQQGLHRRDARLRRRRSGCSGTLAATAVSAWHGARVFRAHQVAETRQVLDMVASIKGDPPAAHALCAASPDRRQPVSDCCGLVARPASSPRSRARSVRSTGSSVAARP